MGTWLCRIVHTFFSVLRRGEFRYTTMLDDLFFASASRRTFWFVLRCSMFSGFFVSREAILGNIFLKLFLITFFRASGEAILGTQRYLIKALYPSTLSKHFIKALY